jgi:hypothetical protein
MSKLQSAPEEHNVYSLTPLRTVRSSGAPCVCVQLHALCWLLIETRLLIVFRDLVKALADTSEEKFSPFDR